MTAAVSCFLYLAHKKLYRVPHFCTNHPESSELSSQPFKAISKLDKMKGIMWFSFHTEKWQKGLIVLRSTGKFLGRSGICLGFVWLKNQIPQKPSRLQSDWTGEKALQDIKWQQLQLQRLLWLAARLRDLLAKKCKNWGGCIHKNCLSIYITTPKAQYIHQQGTRGAISLEISLKKT